MRRWPPTATPHASSARPTSTRRRGWLAETGTTTTSRKGLRGGRRRRAAGSTPSRTADAEARRRHGTQESGGRGTRRYTPPPTHAGRDPGASRRSGQTGTPGGGTKGGSCANHPPTKVGGGEVAQTARRQKYSPPTPRPPDAQGDGHGNEVAGEAGDGVEAASESERATHEGHWPCGNGAMDDMEGVGDGVTPPRGGRRPRATPSDGQTGARREGDTEGEQGDGNAVGAELTPAPSSTYSFPSFSHRLLSCAHGMI